MSGDQRGKLKNANDNLRKVGGLVKSQVIGKNQKISPRVAERPADNSQRKYQAEVKRLQTLTKDAIPSTQRDVAMPLLHNIAWQKVKLDEARHDLMGESLFVPYDNGGGQSGIREHPGFVAYNKLFTTFSRGIKQLIDLMDYEAGEIDELQGYFDETRI